MKNLKKKLLRTIFLTVDMLVLTGGFGAVWFQYYNLNIRHPLYRGSLLLIGVYLLLLLILTVFMKGHQVGVGRISENSVAQALAALMTNFVMYFPISLLAYGFINAVPLMILYVAQCAFIVFWMWLSNYIYFHMVQCQKVILVTDNPAGAIIAKKLGRQPDRYQIVGEINPALSGDIIGQIAEPYDALLLCIEDAAMQSRVVNICFQHDIEFFMMLSLTDSIVSSAQSMYVIDTPLVNRSPKVYSIEYLFVKRAFDIFASALAILISSPIWIIVALAIKLGDGGPVFFRQNRLTKDGKIFKIYKFRTMVTDAEKNGERLATVNDSRITSVGRILRKFRLDELPQFLNILAGDMSLVGPRPESVKRAAMLEEKYPEFRYRLKVKAGLTGYAQVYGNYATHSRDKVMMDILYIEKSSILLDLQLMIMTVKALFITEKTEGTTDEQ